MIEFRNVVKTYGSGRRRITALQDASFIVPSGALAGFLGPNGSGKTTSLKLMVGLLRRDSGEVLVKGLDPEREEREVKALTGFLPERPVYPLSVRVEDFLRHVARLRRVPWSDVRRIARLVGINGYLDKPIKAMSRGYLQRLGLAQALLSQPEILLLDEPTANLDPIARMEILELIATLKRDLGATVIISSHILPELQLVIDHAVFIHRGIVIDYGRLEELSARYGAVTIYEVKASREPRRVAQQLIGFDYVRGILIKDDSILEVHVDSRASVEVHHVLNELVSEGLVLGYEARSSYLDQLYRRAVEGAG